MDNDAMSAGEPADVAAVADDAAVVVEPVADVVQEQSAEVAEATEATEAAAEAADGAVVQEEVYGLDDGGEGEDAAADGGGGGEDGFAIVWPEGAVVSDEVAAVATAAARDAGLTDGAAAGVFVVRALEGINAAAAAARAADDAQLKADWGAEFAARKRACQGFLQRLRDESGVSEEVLAPLMSARGFRVVHALLGHVGEGAAAGIRAGVSESERSWARAAMSDPGHADYAALHDVQHPRWRAVNERYNRSMGF